MPSSDIAVACGVVSMISTASTRRPSVSNQLARSDAALRRSERAVAACQAISEAFNCAMVDWMTTGFGVQFT